MLIPLIGSAGTGKTTYIVDKMRELAEQGEQVMLIVPEQFSFEMERRVIREIGGKAATQIQVMSFTRLCHRVFQQYGGGAGERVTEPAKRMLLNLTLDLVKDQLVQYRRTASSAGFIELVLQVIEQFKNAGITPASLQDFSQTTANEALGEKTAELFQIYGVYQGILEGGYLDERDDLTRCAHLLEGKNYFKNMTVFLDSFRDFTPAEEKIIGSILESCKAIYLSILSKNLVLIGKDESDCGNDVFRIVKENALHIISAAKEQATPVMAPVTLKKGLRFQDDALEFLEDMMTKTQKTTYPGNCEAIRIFRATSLYEELRFTAAQIVRLVKNEGYRYRDIAIIARNLEPYEAMMEQLFNRFEIPLFWDKRADVQSIPVVNGILEALEAISTGFDTEHILALGKNPILGLPYTDVLQLENYCYVWSIKKNQWTLEFQNHPRGLVSEFGEDDLALLDQINATARKIMEPLLCLRDTIQDCNGLTFAQGVYQYLEEVHARENLLAAYGQEDLTYQRILQENDEAWNILMDILDTMAAVLEDFNLPLNRFLELFRMGILCSDFGSIPNTLDQVSVGTADRMRPNAPKAVFVLGMNQGEFPPQIKEQGFFSDLEREEMAQAGIRLGQTVLRQSGYEQLYLYSALTAASHKLYITYHQTLTHGEPCAPAPLVQEIKNIFGGAVELQARDLPPLFFAVNEKTAFELLCQNYHQDDGVTAALRAFSQESEDSGALERLESVLEKRDFVIRRREVARMLFGDNMRLSPSRVEKYFSCPFAYFCSAGLGLRARQKVEFSPIESGNVIHYVLEKMVSHHGGHGLAELSREALEEEASQLLREYLQSRVSQEELLTKRFQYLYQNLARQLARLLEQLAREFSQSQFEPCAFELPIGKGSDVPPMIFETADGVRISVEGIVDRVDLMEQNGVRYVRVVDYKSGSKSFQLDDVYYGLNLQMLLYLFSIWENGKGELSGALPGGVLYVPAKDPVVSVSRQATEKEILQEKMKKYKMNGLVLNDPVCIEGMEREVAGVYIPAKLKADGTLDARSSVASLAQMGQIRGHIQRLLEQMASSLTKGQIEACPVESRAYEPCKYCDFQSICQHQKDDKTRSMRPLGRAGFFDRIGKEDFHEPAKMDSGAEERH